MTKLNVISTENLPIEPWYKDGLRFKCTECGKCCSGTPGYVWVDENEITAMAKQLNLPIDLFKRKYLRSRDNRYALIEKKSATSDDYDCIFLKNKKCTIYEARPTQCRTYPWWEENLNSKESWDCAAIECEGINEEAPIVPYAKIQQMLLTQVASCHSPLNPQEADLKESDN